MFFKALPLTVAGMCSCRPQRAGMVFCPTTWSGQDLSFHDIFGKWQRQKTMEARALAGRRVDAVERAGATMVCKFCKC